MSGVRAGNRTALDTIARTIKHWLEWQKRERDHEGLATDGDTHVMRVPVWPSRGMFEAWIAALEDARDQLPASGLHGDRDAERMPDFRPFLRRLIAAQDRHFERRARLALPQCKLCRRHVQCPCTAEGYRMEGVWDSFCSDFL